MARRAIEPRIGRRPYWVPSNCRQLRQVLREMGVTQVSGKPLSRVRRAQLYAVYFAMRERKEQENEAGRTTTVISTALEGQ